MTSYFITVESYHRVDACQCCLFVRFGLGFAVRLGLCAARLGLGGAALLLIRHFESGVEVLHTDSISFFLQSQFSFLEGRGCQSILNLSSRERTEENEIL
jgi:hypothetical protein